LVSNLDSLADALPEIEEKGRRAEKGKIKMDSLTSGKGLMRRRGKVEQVERERFGRNLGLLMGSQTAANNMDNGVGMQVEGVQAAQPSATAKRFQALRAWIGETMEKDGAFEGKS
jgi:hypothetical protein